MPLSRLLFYIANQFGFLCGKSAVQQLLSFHNHNYSSVYHSISIMATNMMLSIRSFTRYLTVFHMLCLSFGITGKLWQWFRSYHLAKGSGATSM